MLGNPSVLGKLDSITHLSWWMPVGYWQRGAGSKDMPKASGRGLGTVGGT